jgi:hypothetical protein
MTQTLLLTLTAFFSGYTGIVSLPFPMHMKVEEVEPAAKLSSIEKSEILWLSRVIFSETKDEDEMNLVGWVVRNRVEAEYRGNTYEEVALSAKQFSGLNPKDEQYDININIGYDSENEKWMKALAVAEKVYFAGGDERPFSSDVKHFYSPMSISGTPEWAEDGELDYEVLGDDGMAPRFAFYSGVK